MVILDSRPTLREQVEIKVRKAHNLLWVLLHDLGLKLKMVRWLYVSIIWPFISFVFLVWWPGCQTAVTLWQGLISTQRQAQEFISGPNLAAKPRLLSFNRKQYRVIIGLVTGRNNPRRHLYITVKIESPLCKKCEAEEETSGHAMCKCEALATLKHTYMGSFFLNLENVRNLSLGAIWNFIKQTGLP